MQPSKRFEIPRLDPVAIVDLGPIIDPPFVGSTVRKAPDAGIELVDVPFEVLPDRPAAPVAARARKTAEADPRVIAALGRRSEFIGLATMDHKDHERSELQAVWYAYDTNQRVSVRTDAEGVDVRDVLVDACQPALTSNEQARANEVVAKSGRLPDACDGRGLLLEVTDPGDPRYGHRLVDLRFDPDGTRLPRWWAVIDLSTGELVDAGDIPRAER